MVREAIIRGYTLHNNAGRPVGFPKGKEDLRVKRNVTFPNLLVSNSLSINEALEPSEMTIAAPRIFVEIETAKELGFPQGIQNSHLAHLSKAITGNVQELKQNSWLKRV